MSRIPTYTLALTGASGIQYGLRLLECLLRAEARVYLLMSQPAQVVAGMETDLGLPARSADIAAFLRERHGVGADRLQVFGQTQWTAPIASGTGVNDGMVVCPCTTGTLAAIATGQSRTLIERAADVVLKERRTLILMPREMPLSEIHLEHMLKLARMGAVMMPPNPGFYHRPQSVEDLVDFVVARVLDHLRLAHDLLPRWGGEPSD